MLRRLNGQHDRPRLVEALGALVARGELTVQQDGEPVTDKGRVQRLLREALEQALAQFVRNSLLIG